MTESTVIRGGKPFAGRQGLSYFEGVSAESAGAQALCMHLLKMPPGASPLADLHEAHERRSWSSAAAHECARCRTQPGCSVR